MAAKRAQLRISVFSAKPYVRKFLQGPIEAAGFTSANFISVSVAPTPGVVTHHT
jgi:hypothetical protein